MTKRKVLAALIALVLGALATDNAAAAASSGTVGIEPQELARKTSVNLAQLPPPAGSRCVGGRKVGSRCICPPGTINERDVCVPAPPPQKFETMSPRLGRAQPTAPIKATPLCTGGKVLSGGSCVCPHGTVVVQGNCIPRATR